jgi:hypothetical protein
MLTNFNGILTMNLTILNPNTPTMPLKEITDLLAVDHSKAMKKVTDMAQDVDFGSVAKMEIAYNLAGQTTETYLLNKRQSIAVASRLNTSLLMKIIDRWQELEEVQQRALPQTHIEAVRAYLETLETVETQKLTLVQQMGVIEDKKVITNEGEEYHSVKRIKELNPNAVIGGRKLATSSAKLNIPPKALFTHYDINNPMVWHISVCVDAYPELEYPE